MAERENRRIWGRKKSQKAVKILLLTLNIKLKEIKIIKRIVVMK